MPDSDDDKKGQGKSGTTGNTTTDAGYQSSSNKKKGKCYLFRLAFSFCDHLTNNFYFLYSRVLRQRLHLAMTITGNHVFIFLLHNVIKCMRIRVWNLIMQFLRHSMTALHAIFRADTNRFTVILVEMCIWNKPKMIAQRGIVFKMLK